VPGFKAPPPVPIIDMRTPIREQVMYIQSVTAQVQYAMLQLAGYASQDTQAEERSEPSQPLFTGFDRVELSAWAISISRQTLATIESPAAPEVTDSPADARKTPSELIADLRGTIETLKQEGTISERMARHLDRLLDHAADSVESGRLRRATRLMRHFARHIGRLTDHGRMTEESGSALIETARDAIHQLRAERHHRWHADRTPSQAQHEQDGSISVRAGVILLFAEFKTAHTE
jgi:hypothetical protein